MNTSIVLATRKGLGLSLLVALLFMAGCRASIPAPAPTPPALLTPGDAIAIVQFYLMGYKPLIDEQYSVEVPEDVANAILFSKGEAKYLGDRLWEVHFTQSQVRFELFVESLFLDSKWYVWEPGKLVEPANDEAMLVLVALEEVNT